MSSVAPPANSQQLLELEEMVVNAWPAAETAELDGWLLRASSGVTHRGNSVAPLELGSSLTLNARIERVEAWYAARNQRPMFQLGPCAAPVELDQLLADRGYRTEGEASLALASPAHVVSRTQGPQSVRIEPKLSAAWRAIGVHASRFAASEAVLLGFLRRLGSRCRFATAYDEQLQPIASAIGITSEDRLGVYAMITLPQVRRRGAAKAILHALAQSALAEQCSALYLMVETDNLAARALYAQAGFVDEYSYHYRSAPAER